MELITYLRSYRFFAMPIFDLLGTALLAAVIGYYLGFRDVLTQTLWIITFFLIGIVTHLILRVDTMLGYYLGLNKKPIRKTT